MTDDFKPFTSIELTADQLGVLKDIAGVDYPGCVIGNASRVALTFLCDEGFVTRWPRPALTAMGKMYLKKLDAKPTSQDRIDGRRAYDDAANRLGLGVPADEPDGETCADVIADLTSEGEVEDDGDVTLYPELDTPSRTVRFDEAMKTLTADRGAVYGPPSEDFARINALKQGVASCANPEVRHALEMICVKMARLCQTPDHYDSALDIAGYARTIMMVLDEQEVGA